MPDTATLSPEATDQASSSEIASASTSGAAWLGGLVRPFDVGAVAEAYRAAEPTHYFCIDDFLEPGFAREVAAAYPGWEAAQPLGRQFRWVNEDVKVQITEAERFPDPVRRLHELLAAPAFLDVISRITGIPRLLADRELAGGGMHVMGPSGHLGVHLDFNLLRDRQLHRRLNILVYLTPDWDEAAWDGAFELWDPAVKQRTALVAPRFNRCVVFNTTDKSFHGVRHILCPPGVTRNSFAAFYYTEEPPPHWDGRFHDTIYKARPGEWRKAWIQMPRERAQRWLVPRIKRARNKLLGRS